jgi:transcriptional antiterminator NusG
MTDTNWYALWVRSRCEFMTAGELARKGIEHYLPSVPKTRQWKDRKKKVDFPLFPGYLFVHVPRRADAFLQTVKTRGAVSFVSLEPGLPTPVAEEEISSLKILMESGATFDIYPGLQAGTAVRIKRGPLCGAVGVFTHRADEQHFAVNVDILGRSVGLKISADDVEQM